MLEPAHIGGVSKSGDALATAHRLQWRHDLPHQTAKQRVTPRGPSSLPLWLSARPFSGSSLTGRWRSRLRRRHHRSSGVRSLAARRTVGHLARLTVSSRTASRSSMTSIRQWPSLIRLSSVPSAAPQRMLWATGLSSTSIAVGVPRSTRNNSFERRSQSTAQERKRLDGSPHRRRLPTFRVTRSTLADPLPRRGCRNMARSTDCARSTATNHGTTNCAPSRSMTAARPCMPTLRTIPGCGGDQLAGHRMEDGTVALRESDPRCTRSAPR